MVQEFIQFRYLFIVIETTNDQNSSSVINDLPFTRARLVSFLCIDTHIPYIRNWDERFSIAKPN